MDMVVSGPRGRTGKWAQAAWARAFEKGGKVLGIWGMDSGVDKVVSGPSG